ncbi:hypothetical protein FA95DRAFT_1205564 [Auriscalpium vulgare]|uniref:Uncharacterized protein n=1 Tax=Auriscalpium vulgare TaxID=40419 RepID=A0ACB8RTP2_9AGAM|nr:hypothetical protein FA95DRAFT_1205564 [Auriscalpium vulgare]
MSGWQNHPNYSQPSQPYGSNPPIGGQLYTDYPTPQYSAQPYPAQTDPYAYDPDERHRRPSAGQRQPSAYAVPGAEGMPAVEYHHRSAPHQATQALNIPQQPYNAHRPASGANPQPASYSPTSHAPSGHSGYPQVNYTSGHSPQSASSSSPPGLGPYQQSYPPPAANYPPVHSQWAGPTVATAPGYGAPGHGGAAGYQQSSIPQTHPPQAQKCGLPECHIPAYFDVAAGEQTEFCGDRHGMEAVSAGLRAPCAVCSIRPQRRSTRPYCGKTCKRSTEPQYRR